MALIFILILLILTFINYLIGGTSTDEYNITKWKRNYQWPAFIISEIIVLVGTFLITNIIGRYL